MGDIRFVVSVDAEKGIATMTKLDKATQDLSKTGEKASKEARRGGDAHEGMWKQMAIGSLAAEGIKKAFHMVVEGIGDAIKGALEEEESENRLRSALETTGRTIGGNINYYKKFAEEKMKVTKHTHEEVEASATLLLQLTNLDQKGVSRAIEGAMGLSAVMGTDLQSATMMVTKAMEGNYTALQRVGIRVDENLTGQAKQAALLEKLGALYPRAEKELNTFGGQLKQLSNYWDEVKESVGGTIVKNEAVRSGMKELTSGLKAMVESDKFKLWLSSLVDVITAVVKGIVTLTKGILDIEDKLFGAKGWEKYINESVRANWIIQQGINTMELKRKAIDRDILTGKEWAAAYKKYGHDYSAMMKAIAEGKEGEKLQALFTELKTGAEEAKKEAERLKPAINEVGNAGAEAAKRASALKTELKLTFAEDVRKEIGSIEEALKLFQGKLTPDGAQALKDRLADLRGEMDGSKKATEDYKKVLDSVLGPSVAEKLNNQRMLTRAQEEINQSYKDGKIDIVEYEKACKELEKQQKDNVVLIATALPKSTRNLGMVFNQTVGSMKWNWEGFGVRFEGITQEMGKKWAAAMGKVKQTWDQYMGQMQDIFSQAQTNREISIENEYKKRLDYINANVKDEDARQKAVVALDAEFEIKRTSAKRAGAKQAKAVALMGAVVNTADAVTKSLAAAPFPFNVILAAATAALGAVQIGLISRQPIPLARGGVFTTTTRLTDNRGTTYEVGEGGEPEILSPESKLRSIFRAELEQRGNRGDVVVKVYIGEREIEDFVVKTVQKRINTRQIWIPAEVLR